MRKPKLINELYPYWEKYTSDQYQDELKPLKIVFQMKTPVLGYDNIMIDALLARCVVDQATKWGLNDEDAPFLLPVPLKIAWINDNGLPLWCANPVNPYGQVSHGQVFFHKRFIREEHGNLATGGKRSNITPIKGRFKEKRMSVPSKYAKYWTTTCIGNIEEISMLLSNVQAIGKRRYGLIENIFITEIESFKFDRFVPVEYLYKSGDFPLDVAMRSWTPPYWVGVPETRGWCVKYEQNKDNCDKR